MSILRIVRVCIQWLLKLSNKQDFLIDKDDLRSLDNSEESRECRRLDFLDVFSKTCDEAFRVI